MRLTANKKATPALMLLALATLLAAWFPNPANAQQYPEPEQYAPQHSDPEQYAQQGPVTATGVLETAAPHDPDPAPIYALTDEATGTAYELTSGFVELEPFVGQRVTIEGVPVPGSPPPGAPLFLNVTSIVPADDPGGGETATLSFELTVEGEPPAGATFSGVASIESWISTPLTDPDGDGLHTGSVVVPATGGGQGGPPEPLSLPVQIVQDGTTAIKDFGTVTIDGDKTFEASVSFGDGGENPGSNNPGNPGNGTDPGDGGGSRGSGSGGTMGTLPETGGFALLAAATGALLVVGGLVARRVLRR